MLKKIRKMISKGGGTGATPANEITMYATRFCPYCMRARMLFQQKGWEVNEISVDGDPARRAEMMEKSGRHTVPQIWIGERHIGGCDDLWQLHASGELDNLVMGAGNE